MVPSSLVQLIHPLVGSIPAQYETSHKRRVETGKDGKGVKPEVTEEEFDARL